MAFLPPNLKIMFNPRPPPPFLPPPPPSNLPTYTGLTDYLSAFTDPSKEDPFKKEHIESLEEKREKKRKLKISDNEEKISKALKAWDPYSNPETTGDPYKTIFVSRISYKTTQQKLEFEFGQFGPIKSLFLVKEANNPEKHTGYAFIEFERERDMKAAYKQADGMKIDDRRIVVDIERGRVIKNWKPRKFGGGLGNTRAGGADVNQTFSGREMSESREKEKEKEKEREKERERMEKMKKRDGGLSSNGNRSNGSGSDRSGERDRERDRDRDRERDRGSDRDRDRERERDRDRDRGSDRDRGRGDRDHRGDRERDRDERDRSDRGRGDRGDRGDRERGRDDRDRDRGRDDRDRERDRDRGRDDRDRERGRDDRDRGRDDRRGSDRDRDHRGGDERRRDQRDYGSISDAHFDHFQYQQQQQQPSHHHQPHHQPHPERVNRDYSMISNENGF
ncbi:hypothetical protein ACTFIV_001243 [Dictyostelium citrinum]